MPVRPEPMPLPTQQPGSIYTCFLPHDFCGTRKRRGPDVLVPVAPIQRSRPKCHCPLAGAGGKQCCNAKTRRWAPRFTFLFSLPPCGRVGVGGNASTVVVAAPTPNPSPQGGGEQRESKQSARRRRRHVALALHDDLVERSEIGLGGSHQRVRIGTARGPRTTFISPSNRHFGLSIGALGGGMDLIQLQLG